MREEGLIGCVGGNRSCDFAVTSFFRFYKGVGPLWARQIPYTMMKFACFERTVEALYKYVVPKKRQYLWTRFLSIIM